MVEQLTKLRPDRDLQCYFEPLLSKTGQTCSLVC
jgi:hypothetical protein